MIKKADPSETVGLFFSGKTGNTLQTGLIVKKFIILQALLIEEGKKLR